MQPQPLESRRNARVQAFCRLRDSAGARRDAGRFVLEGLRLCADCVETGGTLFALYVTKTALDKGGARMDALLSGAKEVFLISDPVAEKLSDTVTTQGVFAEVPFPKTRPFAPAAGERYLALDAVQNPQNLGAAARTAEALGLTGILLFGGCDRFSPKALRASMGALLRLPVWEAASVSETLAAAARVLPVFAAVPDKTALPVQQADFSGGAVVVVGNEANGVRPETLECARRLTVPMAGRAESLNAAAAAAILIWEMVRA